MFGFGFYKKHTKTKFSFFFFSFYIFFFPSSFASLNFNVTRRKVEMQKSAETTNIFSEGKIAYNKPINLALILSKMLESKIKS